MHRVAISTAIVHVFHVLVDSVVSASTIHDVIHVKPLFMLICREKAIGVGIQG